MLRFSAFVFAVLALAGGAVAQQPGQPKPPKPGEPQTLNELIDFVLRPQIAGQDEEDIWNWDTEPEPSLLESEIGPPLAGPTGEEEIGPQLFGPQETREAHERKARAEAEADPFAALGVRMGPFVIRPSIEIGVIATDNVARAEGGPSAVGLVAAPALNIRSVGDRHEVEANLSAEATRYDKEEFNDVNASARVNGRYDLSATTAIVGEGGYARYQEDFSDENVPSGATERPVVHAFDATLGVEQRFGRFTVHPSGFVDRTLHDDVAVGGGIASRRELDNTEYGGRLRTAYALGAGISPFTEVAVGRRDYDQAVDESGVRRSSLWGELLGGLAIDRGGKLSAEVSLGVHHEELEDDSLPEINAVLANASILWSPRRLTEVQVDLTTDVLTSSQAGEAGSVLYSGLVTVARRITPRVRLAGGGGISYEDSIGGGWHDVTFTGFAEASYAFSRTASVIARYDYEQVESTEVGGDSRAHTVSVRLRLQR